MSRRWLFRLLAAAPSASDHVSDAELLRRFITSNDSAAFELLIHRHADAVWAAVARILRNDADAEDAFQATFLVLIRKAKSIRKPCVGGWLHRVAVNAALKLRENRGRTSLLESQQLDALPAAPIPQADADVAAVLHEELAGLSERERLPIVLCDLEGLSHADAAKSLGWPVGTVSGRLSRARAKLRERLARRGLSSASVFLPALTAPSHLIPNAVSLTSGVVPPAVVSLTEGVLAMTSTASWKWILVTAVCAATLGAGGVFAFGPGAKMVAPPNVVPAAVPIAADNPASSKKDELSDEEWIPKYGSGGKPPTAFPKLEIPDPGLQGKERLEQFAKLCPRLTGAIAVKIDPKDNTQRKLLKARLHYGVIEIFRFREIIRLGSWNQTALRQVIACLNDMQTVAIDLWGGQPKELKPWLEELVVMAKEFERFIRIRVELGTAGPQDYDEVVRHRLAAELALWEAGGR